MEALRRVETSFQVCSHVLPSASSFRSTHKVIIFLLGTWKVTINWWKEFSLFLFDSLTGAVPCCLVQFFLFVCLRDSLRSGTFAQVSLLCHPSFRCKVGVKDFICTRWQRLSAVKYRRLGRSIGPFVTITNNIITELNITLQRHHTLESDFSLTIDDKFHSCSLLCEIHRVGEPSQTSLISHPVPPLPPPPPKVCVVVGGLLVSPSGTLGRYDDLLSMVTTSTQTLTFRKHTKPSKSPCTQVSELEAL